MVHDLRFLDVPDHAHHGHAFEGLQDLIGRVPGEHIRQERLQAASRVESDRIAWADFKVVFGVPSLVKDEGREVNDSTICLMTQPASEGQENWQLRFHYALQLTANQSHVSAVYYWGSGEDTNMVALLIQPHGENGMLSLWTNDGCQWVCKLNWPNLAIPAAGAVSVAAVGSKWTLSIDQKMAAELDVATFTKPGGQFGIRLCGAKVYPSTEPQSMQNVSMAPHVGWMEHGLVSDNTYRAV